MATAAVTVVLLAACGGGSSGSGTTTTSSGGGDSSSSSSTTAPVDSSMPKVPYGRKDAVSGREFTQLPEKVTFTLPATLPTPLPTKGSTWKVVGPVAKQLILSINQAFGVEADPVCLIDDRNSAAQSCSSNDNIGSATADNSRPANVGYSRLAECGAAGGGNVNEAQAELARIGGVLGIPADQLSATAQVDGSVALNIAFSTTPSSKFPGGPFWSGSGHYDACGVVDFTATVNPGGTSQGEYPLATPQEVIDRLQKREPKEAAIAPVCLTPSSAGTDAKPTAECTALVANPAATGTETIVRVDAVQVVEVGNPHPVGSDSIQDTWYVPAYRYITTTGYSFTANAVATAYLDK